MNQESNCGLAGSSTYELESMVKSHERALCLVADTEEKALFLIHECFAVAFTALALALATFFMVVTS